jgi:hypothetical protein
VDYKLYLVIECVCFWRCVGQMQPVGEAEMAEEEDCSPRWTLEGQNLGQDGPSQPPLLPSPHLEQSAERRQSEAHHTCPSKMA